jgi:hypothetical protein
MWKVSGSNGDQDTDYPDRFSLVPPAMTVSSPTSRFYKKQGISRLSWWLLASQEALCSVELVYKGHSIHLI